MSGTTAPATGLLGRLLEEAAKYEPSLLPRTTDTLLEQIMFVQSVYNGATVGNKGTVDPILGAIAKAAATLGMNKPEYAIALARRNAENNKRYWDAVSRGK